MQKQIEGRECSSQLPVILRELGTDKILAVTGRDSYASSGAQAVFDRLLTPFDVTYFNDFSPNIEIGDALAGAELCRRVGAQGILAIGGGSAIDMAKCIAAFVGMPGREQDLVTGQVQLAADTLPVIAVPTTGGTGSEATHFAVVYIEGRKYSLAAESLLPAVALLDSTFTDSLPAYITACSGFDALCQAVESFWSVAATPESRGYAREAIPILVATLPTAVNSPDSSVRDTMLRAANLAGKAINISKTTAPHALSYTITSRYGIPHGHAVALSLGAFFPYHDPAGVAVVSSNLSDEDYRANFAELLELLGVDSAAAARSFWYGLMASCGLRCELGSQSGDDPAAIEAIVAGVNPERLANHPVVLDEVHLRELLHTIPWD